MHRRYLSAMMLAGGLSLVVNAGTFKIVPINLGGGYVVTGTIDTDGTVGYLTASNFTGWKITVTQTTDLVFTEQNTISGNISKVSTDGKKIHVPTSRDGFTDGGYLVFTGTTAPGGIATSALVADFTGPNIAGGVAGWQTPTALNYSYLNLPDATTYTAAFAAKGRPNVFNLVPVTITTSPTVQTLAGTITTDGTIGPLTPVNFKSWRILGREQDIQTYTPANSNILNAAQVLSDNTTLTVSNPLGILQIGTAAGVGSRPIIVTIADFTDPSYRNGLASYYYGWNGLVALKNHLTRSPTYVVATQ